METTPRTRKVGCDLRNSNAGRRFLPRQFMTAQHRGFAITHQGGPSVSPTLFTTKHAGTKAARRLPRNLFQVANREKVLAQSLVQFSVLGYHNGFVLAFQVRHDRTVAAPNIVSHVNQVLR